MATELKPQFPDESRVGLERRQGIPPLEREFRLNFRQVVILWSALIGIMVAVFLIGFFAGRGHGIQLALETHDEQEVWLPLSANIGSANIGSANIGSANIGVSEPLAVTTGDKAPIVEKTSTEAETITTEPAAGFLAKAANSQQASVSSNSDVPKVKPRLNKIEKLRDTQAAKDSPSKAVSAQLKPEKVSQKDASSRFKPGFYVQVAAPTDPKVTERLAQAFRDKGFQASVQEAQLERGKFFRLLIGPYSSTAEATKAQQRIRSFKLTKDKPFIKRIN